MFCYVSRMRLRNLCVLRPHKNHSNKTALQQLNKNLLCKLTVGVVNRSLCQQRDWLESNGAQLVGLGGGEQVLCSDRCRKSLVYWWLMHTLIFASLA